MDLKIRHWTLPSLTTATGRFARLEALSSAHLTPLYDVIGRADTIWTFMPNGPFADEAAFSEWLTKRQGDGPADWRTYVVMSPAGNAPVGMASFMRQRPEVGSIEIGAIAFAPAAQRTAASSEAIMLLARHALSDLVYRRLEWKCDAANEPSRRAAARFGFSYEGRFRQDLIVRARNRDTDWFSIIDSEWPAINAAWSAWLSGIDAAGRQSARLENIIRAHLDMASSRD